MIKLTSLFTLALAGVSLTAFADVKVTPPDTKGAKEVKVAPLKLRPQSNLKIVEAVSLEKLQNPIPNADTQPIPEGLTATQKELNKARVPQLGHEDAPLIYGVKIYDSNWTTPANYDFGLYSISAADGDVLPVSMGQHFYGREVAVKAGQYYYSAVPLSDGTAFYYRVDLDNYTVYGPNRLYPASMISAFEDAETGVVYGCFLNDERTAYYWCTFDVDACTPTPLASLGTNSYMAVDQAYDGQIYGIDIDGNFGKINKDTGAMTIIKATGLQASNKTGGCIDRATGKFYYIHFINTGSGFTSDLYSIDLATGDTGFVCTVPGGAEWTGMFIPRPPYAAKVPAAATNLNLDYPEFATRGYVEFKLPTNAYDGTALEGKVSYRILFDGVEIATGQDDPGEDAYKYINLDDNSLLEPNRRYTVSVEVSNEAGRGPVVSEERFFGYDEIGTISNVQLKVEDDEFVLTWDKPVGKNGGYVDYESRVAYDIYFYPGEKLVKGDLPGTVNEYRYKIPANLAKGNYYFGIYPWIVSPGITAYRDEVYSNKAVYGSFDLPFGDNFGTTADISYTIINANNDEQTWEQGPQYAAILYNSTLAMDDWMIAGPVEIPANTPLKLTLNAGSNGYDEKVAIYLGTTPDAESMTRQIMAPVLINEPGRTFVANFFEETGGQYYLGFHGCSDADQYMLTLNDFLLEINGSADAPGKVTDVKTIRKRNEFELSADLEFKAPTLSAKSEPLTSNMSIRVTMNDEELETFEDVAPGQLITINDIPVPTFGNQRFAFTASNESGDGMTTEETRYVGWASPKKPEWMRATPQEEDNVLRVSWATVTQDVNGDEIPQETLWYQPMIVYASGAQRTAGNGIYYGPAYPNGFLHNPVLRTDNGMDDQPDVQQFVSYYTCCYYYDKPGMWQGNSYSSSHTFSNKCPVGPAYELPYLESFTNCMAKYIMQYSSLGTNGDWTLLATSSSPSASPYDGDKGMLVFRPEAYGDMASFESGMISLRKAANPTMSLWYYAVPGSTDKLTVEIDDLNGFASEAVVELGQTGEAGWTELSIDLSKYAGKKIRYNLIGEAVSGTSYILVDHISILDGAEKNLGITGMQAPSTVKVGSDVTLTVEVSNTGVEPISGYTLAVKANGKELGYASYPGLASGESATADFTVKADVVHEGALTFEAQIECSEDEFEVDNSKTLTVIVESLPYPTVGDLTAEKNSDGSISLAWSQPDFTAIKGITVTEGAEDLVRFSNGMPGSNVEGDDMGGWTVIDGDGGRIGQALTGLPDDRTGAWMVFGFDGAGISNGYREDYTPRTGDQCFLAPYTSTAEEGNDDWLISPRLSGAAQTIRFYAKAVMDGYGMETYEVWYSTTGTDKDDFVQVGEGRAVDAQWTEDVVTLPEGARHFAIRYTAYDVYGLMVDDITFEKWGLEDDVLEHVGYNVYHNYEVVNETPIEDTSYVHNLGSAEARRAPEAEDVAHTYHVTAVYTAGESDLSNPATVSVNTGVELVSADGKVTVSVEGSSIVVRGAEGMDIDLYTPDARHIATYLGENETRIPVTPGIYLVKVGKLTCKVII